MERFSWIATAIAGIIIAAGIGVWTYSPQITISVGYKAKILCSGIFLSRRNASSVLNVDLTVDGYESLRFFTTDVDRSAKTVTVSAMGLWRRVAVYRDGLGCTLAIGTKPSQLQAQTSDKGLASRSAQRASGFWPEGERVDLTAVSSDVDRDKLMAAIKVAFSEPDPTTLQRTRSIVVVHRGRIVAERYANGFDARTPQLGWSMSKSVLNALVGIIISNDEVTGQLNHRLNLDSTNLLPEWRRDERTTISLGNLLQMSSGLEFSEDYTDYRGDVLQMLFAKGNKGRYAASKSKIARPGRKWSYSSGTSNVLSYLLRRHFKRKSDYFAFPKRYLFEPIGMLSAVIEPDASGSFVASSFMYASARDWARLGLFYLNDGVWAGRRILPQGWISNSIKPAPTASSGLYGSHFWLKLPKSPKYGEPPLPKDSFYMLGHGGQVVAIIPSRSLVIVRLGLARKPGAWNPTRILGAVAAAFPPNK